MIKYDIFREIMLMGSRKLNHCFRSSKQLEIESYFFNILLESLKNNRVNTNVEWVYMNLILLFFALLTYK